MQNIYIVMPSLELKLNCNKILLAEDMEWEEKLDVYWYMVNINWCHTWMRNSPLYPPTLRHVSSIVKVHKSCWMIKIWWHRNLESLRLHGTLSERQFGCTNDSSPFISPNHLQGWKGWQSFIKDYKLQRHCSQSLLTTNRKAGCFWRFRFSKYC